MEPGTILGNLRSDIMFYIMGGMIDERVGARGAKAQAILDYIKRFVVTNQYPPSRREIQDGCGISSTSIVSYHLESLRRRGLIHIADGVARGIRVL